MRHFERNRNRKSMWESTPVLVILGLAALAFAWSVVKFSIKMAETREKKAAALGKVEALREQQAALMEDIERLKTDRGKEEVFREHYGLAKAGEEVIVIVEDETPPPSAKRGGFRGFISGFLDWFR